MQHRISRALLSVSDKTGIVDFAHALVERGVLLLSTGGTARTLREAGLEVTDVSAVTGFPEIMDGRVKTLHPSIHGGLLGRLDNPGDVAQMEEHGITSIDLVVVNLYPFEQTLDREEATHDELIEQIDIGGPAMTRASAKNYRHTAIIVNPARYTDVLAELDAGGMALTEGTRLRLSAEAFAHTARYDTLIAGYLAKQADSSSEEETSTDDAPATYTLNLPRALVMRYGENPHQRAGLYGNFTNIFEHLHGKELSYNNIVDIDAAAKAVLEFEDPAVVIVKHTNPCGVAIGSTLNEAWERAFATDTASPFGGIVAVNRPLDVEAAETINSIFTEVVIAPEFPEETLALLRKKRDRRLIRVNLEKLRGSFGWEAKSVAGGLLVQSADTELFAPEGLRVVSKRQPTEQEMAAMQFAWRVAKHVKSNAIVYAAPDRTLGVGAGQMSRIDSALIAARKAERAGLDLKGCAVASDAFFPFADGLMEAVAAGATAAIQPGGSVRDAEVIEAADANNIAMVMTGMRHFRH